MGAADVLALRAEGKTFGQIARDTGLTKGQVAGIIWRSTHSYQRKGYGVRHGAHNANSRLTEDQARAIRVRRNAGETLRALAAEFGVDPTHIHMIAAGKRWAHVQ